MPRIMFLIKKLPPSGQLSLNRQTFWISVQYPTALRIHQIHVRGRIAGESPSHWRFEGSNDDVKWDVLLSPPTPTYLSSSLNVFDIPYSATAYHRFKLFVIQGSGVNCGLRYLQLFPYSVVQIFFLYIIKNALDFQYVRVKNNVYSSVLSIYK